MCVSCVCVRVWCVCVLCVCESVCVVCVCVRESPNQPLSANLNIVKTSISLVTVINYSGNEGLNNQ